MNLNGKLKRSKPVSGFGVAGQSGIRFEIRVAKSPVLKRKRWFVLMIARNNEVLMVSQMYKHHRSAIRLLEIIERYVSRYS